MALGKRQTVDEALAYFMPGQKWRKLCPVADMRVNDGLRKETAQGLKHLFAAPVSCEPVVDEGYAHLAHDRHVLGLAFGLVQGKVGPLDDGVNILAVFIGRATDTDRDWARQLKIGLRYPTA